MQVIVGSNGAGKSTILKLAVRLYDPDEGSIFVNGYDVRVLKLHDLRRVISVLFQDYTHFPFTVRLRPSVDDIYSSRPSNRSATTSLSATPLALSTMRASDVPHSSAGPTPSLRA